MPQKSSPTPAAGRSKRLPWPLIILGVILVLAIGSMVGWKLYHNSQVASDKARFAQAERDIEDLSSQVVAAVGAPAKSETQKYCSRPNLKFEEGPLSCDVHWYGYYEVNSAEQATSVSQETINIIETKWGKIFSKSLDNEATINFRDLNPSPEINPPRGDFLRILGEKTLTNEMKCKNWSSLYISTKAPYENFYSSNASPYVLAIDITCGDEAKIEHFPMKS